MPSKKETIFFKKTQKVHVKREKLGLLFNKLLANEI